MSHSIPSFVLGTTCTFCTMWSGGQGNTPRNCSRQWLEILLENERSIIHCVHCSKRTAGHYQNKSHSQWRELLQILTYLQAWMRMKIVAPWYTTWRGRDLEHRLFCKCLPLSFRTLYGVGSWAFSEIANLKYSPMLRGQAQLGEERQVLPLFCCSTRVRRSEWSRELYVRSPLSAVNDDWYIFMSVLGGTNKYSALVTIWRS